MKVAIVEGAGPRCTTHRSVEVPEGATVAEALRAASFTVPTDAVVAVWGRQRGTNWVLNDGDRVEVLRALTADPMEARRRRHAHQAAARSKTKRPLRRTAG